MTRENPWSKKHGRTKVTTKRTPEQVREDLFEAGWRPSMMGMRVPDERINSLLLELDQANRKRTIAKMRKS